MAPDKYLQISNMKFETEEELLEAIIKAIWNNNDDEDDDDDDFSAMEHDVWDYTRKSMDEYRDTYKSVDEVISYLTEQYESKTWLEEVILLLQANEKFFSRRRNKDRDKDREDWLR